MNGMLLKNILCIRGSIGNTLNNVTSGLATNRNSSQQKSNNENKTSTSSSVPLVSANIDIKNPIKKYLKEKSIKMFDGWNTISLTDCCTQSDESKIKKKVENCVHIDPNNGEFFCGKCKIGGDFSKFKQLIESNSLCKLDLLNEVKAKDLREEEAQLRQDDFLVKSISKDLNNAHYKGENHENLQSNKYIREWLNGKSIEHVSNREFNVLLKSSNINLNLKKEILQLLGVKVFDKQLLFPVYDYFLDYWPDPDLAKLPDDENSVSESTTGTAIANKRDESFLREKLKFSPRYKLLDILCLQNDDPLAMKLLELGQSLSKNKTKAISTPKSFIDDQMKDDQKTFNELSCSAQPKKHFVLGLELILKYLRQNKLDHQLNGSKLKNTRKRKRLFITDDLLDMLVLNHSTHLPVISIKSIESFKENYNFMMVSLLEEFDEIIFWQKDKQLSFDLGNMLNMQRCFLINYIRSPYECVLKLEKINKIVQDEIFSMKLSYVMKYGNFKKSVYDELINRDKYAGVKWKRFDQLNSLLKGHRSGELTIFTGSTGCGKTTFLSEYSLDLAQQGVNTLWGSFEIKNQRLVKIMMKQFSRINLEQNLELFESISNEYSKLPIYFMKFHGEETIENVIRTMSNSVLMYGIRHVIIDNLQFMIGTQFMNNIDKYYKQDLIISKFRQFATNFNCHVTLVIHPRKEEANEPLSIGSIFGSAKSTQEADNVFILQSLVKPVNSKIYRTKYLELCKNRFDGSSGKMFLKFNKDSLNFTTPAYNQSNGDIQNEIELYDDCFISSQ